jgi:hypothetical protein
MTAETLLLTLQVHSSHLITGILLLNQPPIQDPRRPVFTCRLCSFTSITFTVKVLEVMKEFSKYLYLQNHF